MKEQFKSYGSIDEMFNDMMEPLPWYRLIPVRIGQGISEVKDTLIHAWQRVFRGYDDRAWWEMDAYLATLIPILVKQLRKNGHGVPSAMYEGLTPDENGNYDELAQATATDKWNYILIEIEEGFKEYLEYQHCNLDPDHKLEKFNRAFDLFREYFSALWD